MYISSLLELFLQLLGGFLTAEFFLALMGAAVVFGGCTLVMYLIRGDKRV